MLERDNQQPVNGTVSGNSVKVSGIMRSSVTDMVGNTVDTHGNVVTTVTDREVTNGVGGVAFTNVRKANFGEYEMDVKHGNYGENTDGCYGDGANEKHSFHSDATDGKDRIYGDDVNYGGNTDEKLGCYGDMAKEKHSFHSDATDREGKDRVYGNEIDETVEMNVTEKYLIYDVSDSPPIHVTIVCALQQALLSLSGQLVVSLLVAQAVCASDNDIIKARLLSSTLFMSGLTTLLMNLFGLRLPLFQGAAATYIVPLLIVANIDGSFCSGNESGDSGGVTSPNTTTSLSLLNVTTTGPVAVEITEDRIFNNIRMLQGSLILSGFVHTLLGFTGLIGVLLRFIGPLTIVPTMVLLFVSIVNPCLTFVEVNWPIAFSTVIVAVILFLYLAKYLMPVPVWTPSAGFRVIRYPLHQVFAILFSIIFNWGLCGVLTSAGVFTDDKDDVGYRARTDARSEIINDNPWFTFPYPGQYGALSYNSTALLSCMIATFISILDSIGDYYACARVCRAPAPPKHAMNRGIFIEGACTMLSGAVGCGHATNSYGGNIGAVGVSKVASRDVFIGVGIIYMLFGIFGKFSAVFITIPYPVLGGAIIVMFGIFFGVVISNLEVTDMSSPRNMAILGLSVFIGLCVPTWVKKVETPIETGDESFDRIMAMLLGNPNLVGTLVACILDNTVPGTDKERGIEAWQVSSDDEDAVLDKNLYSVGYDVYNPLIPKRLLYSKIMKYIPFMPYKRKNVKVANGDTVA